MAKVLITGASAGLGAELAKAFAARGDTLVLAARRLARLEAMKPELLALGAPEVVCYPVDLAEPAEVGQLAEALPGLALDVLINNAALGHWDALWDTPLETLNHMIAINMQALAHLTTAFSAYGKDRPTRLMNVASGAGYALFEGAIPYTATKFFVTALTEGLSLELKRQQKPMRAQLLAPGPIATEFLENSLLNSRMVWSEDALEGVKFHTASEVAALAMTLFDSDATVGLVEPDLSFSLHHEIHRAGQL